MNHRLLSLGNYQGCCSASGDPAHSDVICCEHITLLTHSRKSKAQGKSNWSSCSSCSNCSYRLGGPGPFPPNLCWWWAERTCTGVPSWCVFGVNLWLHLLSVFQKCFNFLSSNKNLLLFLIQWYEGGSKYGMDGRNYLEKFLCYWFSYHSVCPLTHPFIMKIMLTFGQKLNSIKKCPKTNDPSSQPQSYSHSQHFLVWHFKTFQC